MYSGKIAVPPGGEGRKFLLFIFIAHCLYQFIQTAFLSLVVS
jgi:hypothetical protein